MRLRSELFPQPDAPIRQTNSPRATSIVTSSRAWTEPNHFETLRSAIAGCGADELGEIVGTVDPAERAGVALIPPAPPVAPAIAAPSSTRRGRRCPSDSRAA